MKHLSLRAQVFITVGILILGVVSATVYIANAIEGARESIVRLNRERLNSLTGNIARRYSTVLNFVAPEQMEQTQLAERPELLEQFNAITREELVNAPDVEIGFFHVLWNRELVYPMTSPQTTTLVNARTFKQFIPPILQTTYNEQREQWTHYESPAASFLIVTAPVYARNRVVGAAWAFDDLGDELSSAWPQGVTLFLQFVIVLGILLAVSFVITLKRDVNTIQDGLAKMKGDLTTRLPVSSSEMGSIAGSINELANTVLQQQREKEDLQRTIQQKEKLASLGQLIAGVAHEVRTPLAGIKTRIQLWQQAMRSTKKQKNKTRSSPEGPTPNSMRLVVEQLDRMELIVQKLLLFAKRKSPQMQRVNIHEFLDQFIEEISPDAKKQRVRVEREYAPGEPHVLADTSEIRKVFQNLVKNSLDAMADGGILRINTQEATEYKTLLVAVEDSGGGVDPEAVPKIFDPFYTTKHSGVGLGLSIAYEIVRAHNGTIRYERGATGGARFVVSLQLENNEHKREHKQHNRS
ncbi:MAG: ATP-binding protein [Ignavibacteriae bacterium]|nr:ATP-binding protein [Ignavibacteriota bacterium]